MEPLIEQSVQACFGRIVSLYPDRLALKGATRQYSYHALNLEANRVAHAILQQSPARQQQIGILADHGALVGALGILKSGKTYVPLDPSYPPARLVEILRECEIETIVTDNRHLSHVGTLSGQIRAISMDELDAGLSTSDPDVVVGPDDLAAIIYTSGSTGQPKGVMQSHRNILHRVISATKAFDIRPDDRVTLLSSLSYGASLLEIYSTLLNGAALYPFNVAEEGLGRLTSWLGTEKLTVYHSVPTVWRQLTRSFSGKEDLRSLRVVRIGGDTLTTSDVELYRRHFPSSCVLFNSMSCSEAGLIRVYPVAANDAPGERVIPVGYEVDGKKILLLDNDGREVPCNEVGEIVIRGEFLSPGYWKNPELTSASFRPDPQKSGQRLYHTGDLGVLLPDGCLLFKGRKDYKVKIHGINVEMTQLDASLRLHPSVQDAVSVVHVDESGERHLTVYVVPEEGSSVTTSELRRFLMELLPVHMLSAGLVFLDALPLTPNGKVDRQALPRPTGNRPAIGQSFVAPRDEWERNLAMICQTILGIDRIGVEDNFFDLGMDSLKAVQLVTQIEKEFGEEVPPGTLLRSPTVDQLAGVLRQKSFSKSWRSLVPVQPAGSKTPFFWVHGDFSNAFLAQYLGGDQPLYALDHQSQDGSPALHVTVEAIAAEYLREMRSVQGSGPYLLGGYSFGGIIAFEVAHQIQRMGEKVGLLFLLDPPGFTGGGLPESMTTDFRRRGRIRRHLARLASLKTTERLDYVWSRAVVVTQGVFYSRTYGIRKAAKMLLWRIHLGMGKPIPLRLRSAYILDIYNRARLQYAPQVYRGRTMLLRGEQLSSRFHKDWDGLLQGHLERFQLGEVDHVKLREEAYVPLWAHRLKTSLSDAQAKGAVVGAVYDRAIFAGE